MTINANGNMNAAAAALAALQALQLTTPTSPQLASGQSANALGSPAAGTASGSASLLSQSPSFFFNATSQTGPSQSSAQALAQGASLTDAAGVVASSLSDLLQQIQQTATTAADPNVSSATRSDLSTQFSAQLSGFSALLASAQVNGQNLLNGSLTSSPTFAIPGGGTVSVQPRNLSLGGPLVPLSASASVSTASTAATTASLAGLSITSVEAAIGQIYNQGDQISGLAAQLGAAQLGGATSTDTSGDSSGESASLFALQLQQTLSADPSLSLSNPASQAILSLFRG
jgi:flagellin